jgi:acetyl-CoA synthetase
MFDSYEGLQRTSVPAIAEQLLGLNPGEEYNAAELVTSRGERLHPERAAYILRHADGSRQVVSYLDLRRGTLRVSALLQRMAIQPGDRVFGLLEPCPELYAFMLGAIHAGAIMSPLFPAFGVEAIADRLRDAEASLLCTTARQLNKARQATGGCSALRGLLVVGEASLQGGEQDLQSALQGVEAAPQPGACARAAPMLLHYSSGTTGKPKGVLHVHEALLGHVATGKVVLDLHPETDVYWCTADVGWVTGTSYGVMAPLGLGATSVAYSGGFSAEAWYEVIQSERVTVWYTSPTALRLLMRSGSEAASAFDLSSLRHICSVGEPLNPEVVRWGEEVYGLTVHDTWWQTETGCMQIANYPFMPVHPGSMGRPFAGTTAAVVDPESAEPLPPMREGLLALAPPWPSMFRAYWGKPDLYNGKFLNGWYLTGDRAYADDEGYFWFVGRDDDVINTSGHLVGPFEVESALLEHEAVVEAAAFPVPDPDAGDVVAVQVVLRAGVTPSKEIVRDLKTLVLRRVGAHASPRFVEIVDSLPRTRSGKIMRRVARSRHLGLPEGDTSALEDD